MNFSFKSLNNLAGWITFGIAAVVLGLAAEPTGSLWDCGEFISGAYKLQVVHPPGAPIFLLVGRLFTWVGGMLSSDPANIAYSVNLLSAICTAFAGMFICWTTSILARLILVGRDTEPVGGQAIAAVGAGLVAGLCTAFISSVWFSAVEGEVYAMSTFFTAMTLWATLKWYNLPDNPQADRWLVFAFYSVALSIGVHLLSLLTFPALAMFYYFKKSKKPTVVGTLIASLVGVVFIVAIQKVIVAGIPDMWATFDRFFVNGFGLPFNSGLLALVIVFGGLTWLGLSFSSKKQGESLAILEKILFGVIAFFVLVDIFPTESETSAGMKFVSFLIRAGLLGGGLWLLIRFVPKGMIQRLTVAFGVIVVAYCSYGTVVIRANANTPINMNDPADPMRLLPYLNREQYGERPLVRGPHFDAQPTGIKSEERYGRVGNKYAVVDEKVDYEYSPNDETLFPRMGDYSQGRPALYRRWIGKPTGVPTLADNIEFFWKYQLGWMYWRYFMWNFSGRQNGEQGYYSWDPSAGNWITGFDAIDAGRIGNQDALPDFQKYNQARNKYYMIPFLLGLLGMFFHFRKRPRDFAAIMALFIITGIGIIVYSNEPPSEPRERDYVLAGSFFTYCIWIGLGVVALWDMFNKSLKGLAAPLATVLALSAPLLLVTQNWDDHSRAHHFASRDYASNFLNSCEPNAIIFTYGDNDTYPLWYCQEVEGIRTDVRVVNLSLIAVDWYIDQLRRTVNLSPAIEMTIPRDQLRGFKRVQTPYFAPRGEKEMDIHQVLKFLSEDHKQESGGGRAFDTYLPTRKMSIPVNKQWFIDNKFVSATDTNLVDTLHIDIGKDKKYIIKDELAMLDIIASNLGKRPIYWAVTCREDKLLGLEDYLQLEGLGLQIVPKKVKSSMDAYGIIGSGGVSSDKMYQNIMDKWKWGNFDKERSFVDRSYMPSLQTMRVSIIRLARQLVMEGKKDKATALVDRYFEVFPQMNFPYDQFTAFMTDIYTLSGEKTKAAAKIREIAAQMEQQFHFYDSLDSDFKKGYKQDYDYTLSTVQNLMKMAAGMEDNELLKELETKFQPYLPSKGGPQGLPN